MSCSLLHKVSSLQHAWIWLLWLLSQTWISLHIWTPKAERLATTEKLFVTPMYNGLLIDQSLALNRRRDDQADVKTEVCITLYSNFRHVMKGHRVIDLSVTKNLRYPFRNWQIWETTTTMRASLFTPHRAARHQKATSSPPTTSPGSTRVPPCGTKPRRR